MKTYTFILEQQIKKPLQEVFSFFSDANNLTEITPPWLRFVVLTPPPIKMNIGTKIDYRLKLRGIPIRWQSEITEWNPPHHFKDEQRRGPYRVWIHKHTFIESAGGTLVTDEVEYGVLGGNLVNKLFVQPDIEKIFEYRMRRLEELLNP